MTERTSKGQFPPGVSGNPSGRPKSREATDALRAALTQSVTLADGTKTTRLQAVVNRLIGLALQGSVRAIALIFDRLEGRAVTTVDFLDVNEVRIVRLPLAPPSPPLAAGEEGVDDCAEL